MKAARRALLPAALLFISAALHAQEIPLTDPTVLDLRNTTARVTTWHNRSALDLTRKPGSSAQQLAILRNHAFHNGTIEVDLAGALSKTADASDRGFIGIAFRMQSDPSRYECFYIRPTNGRAQDQLRRNHSTQYISMPDWPWFRLRKESPGVYESYADMVEGEWIHMKIVVHGTEAALYLGNAAQPSLLVHDLKLGDTQGAIALWAEPTTDAYFANLKISASTE
jgi:hypothetical protein